MGAVKLSLDPEVDALLAQMSWESHMSKADLAEVAIFNLVALWMKDKHGEHFTALPAGIDAADSAG